MERERWASFSKSPQRKRNLGIVYSGRSRGPQPLSPRLENVPLSNRESLESEGGSQQKVALAIFQQRGCSFGDSVGNCSPRLQPLPPTPPHGRCQPQLDHQWDHFNSPPKPRLWPSFGTAWECHFFFFFKEPSVSPPRCLSKATLFARPFLGKAVTQYSIVR